MENLERRLDEVMRLMRGRNQERPRGRSPPWRESRWVDAEDRWEGGSRREWGTRLSPSLRRERRSSWEERYSPHTRESPPRHQGRTSRGNRSPPSSQGSRPPRRHDRDRKMELPLFDGEDALGWIVRIERYFSINGVEGDERMELVLVALEGRALNWFQT